MQRSVSADSPRDRIIPVCQEVVEFAQVFKNYNVVSIEQSVKTVNDQVNNQRILIKLGSISLLELVSIVNMFGFPNEYLYWLYYHFDNFQHYIMFAYCNQTKTYSLYFERRISSRAKQDTPHTSIKSLKWNETDLQMTDYFTTITRNISTVLHLANLLNATIPSLILDSIKTKKTIDFMLSKDSRSPRLSISIPLKANTVYTGTNLYGFDHYPLKHYQAGKDKSNNSFNTLYFSVYRNIA